MNSAPMGMSMNMPPSLNYGGQAMRDGGFLGEIYEEADFGEENFRAIREMPEDK